MQVSVYLPTKNRLASLALALESVLAQTLQDLEVIVVNDGSTDGTAAYLKNVAARDARVRIITNVSSAGAPAARNAAILASKGQFVTGLDDDDRFEPYRLKSFVGFWKILAESGLSASCLYAQDSWRSGGETISLTSRRGYTVSEDLPSCNSIGNQVFAPRRHYVEAGLFDTGLPAWQDFELFYRMVAAFGPARLVDMPSYVFDATPRGDRISVDEHKIRSAYKKVCQKHFSSAPHDRQRLALQLFSDYYGIKPKLKDLVRFASEGRWITGHCLMLRAALRRARGVVNTAPSLS